MFSRRIIIIAVTVILIATIVFFAIWPGISTILNSQKEIANHEAQQTAAKLRSDTIADLRKNQAQIEEINQIAAQYIPEDQGSSELMVELSTAAQQNNIIINNTTIDQKAPASAAAASDKDLATPAASKTTTPAPTTSSTTASSTKNLDFTLSIAGSFPDMLNFLKNLENGPRLLTIKSITLQSKVDEAGAVNITAQIQGSVYYKESVTLQDTLLDNLKISAATIKKFLDLKNSSAPINLPSGSDFGRGNPFESY
jgi:Tfp pilus assembly protein PilO